MKKLINLMYLDEIRSKKDIYQFGCYKGYLFDNTYVCGLDKEDGWNVYIGNIAYEQARLKRFKTLKDVKNFIDKREYIKKNYFEIEECENVIKKLESDRNV